MARFVTNFQGERVATQSKAVFPQGPNRHSSPERACQTGMFGETLQCAGRIIPAIERGGFRVLARLRVEIAGAVIRRSVLFIPPLDHREGRTNSTANEYSGKFLISDFPIEGMRLCF